MVESNLLLVNQQSNTNKDLYFIINKDRFDELVINNDKFHYVSATLNSHTGIFSKLSKKEFIDFIINKNYKIYLDDILKYTYYDIKRFYELYEGSIFNILIYNK